MKVEHLFILVNNHEYLLIIEAISDCDNPNENPMQLIHFTITEVNGMLKVNRDLFLLL